MQTVAIRFNDDLPGAVFCEREVTTVEVMAAIANMIDSDFEAWIDAGMPDVFIYLNLRGQMIEAMAL